MTFTTFSSGTKAKSSEVNANFLAIEPKIMEIYSSTGFDVSASQGVDGTATDNSDYELTAIDSSNLTDKNYCVVESLVYSSCDGAVNSSGYVTLQIQEKYVGGAYADALPVLNVLSFSAGGVAGDTHTTASTIKTTFAITANHKANGLQVKILANASATRSGTGTTTCSLTNKGTVIYLMR